MKIALTLLMLTILSLSFGQNCSYEVGDSYELKNIKSSNGLPIFTNIRERPDPKAIILKTINALSVSDIEVVDETPQNNFLKVKTIFRTNDIYSKNSTEAVVVITPTFDSIIGWINTSLIEYSLGGYPDGDGWSMEYWNDEIEKQQTYKLRNECKYVQSLYAHSFSQRGILKYKNKEYGAAVSDLSESIKISSTYEWLIRSYAYRAFAKQELEDYLGAIEDYNFAITNYKPKNSRIICDICANYKDKGYTVAGVNYPEICKESLITQRAICKIMLKKYQEAILDLNNVISLNSNWGHAYYIRGQVKDILKDKSGCCKDLSKAGELGIVEAYDEIKTRCNR